MCIVALMTNTSAPQTNDDAGTARMIIPDLVQADRFAVEFGDNIRVAAWRSIDGAIVVQVDAEPGSGRLRVIVNDGPVYDADPES